MKNAERPAIERAAGTISITTIQRWLLLSYLSGKPQKSFEELLNLRLVWDALIGDWSWDRGVKVHPEPDAQARSEGVLAYGDTVALELTAVQVTKIAEATKEAISSGKLNGIQCLHLLELYERLDPKRELK